MSIRYTIRHNIPAEKVRAEDVNDSSTWDLDLIRKHELAETDEHDLVYRQHNGKIVSWAEAATQHAYNILEEVQGVSAYISEQQDLVMAQLSDVSAEVAVLTEDAEEANTAAQLAVVDAEDAVTEAQRYSDQARTSYILSKDWASKQDGKVEGEDYSSKYYAGLAATSESNARSYASAAQSAATSAAADAVSAADTLLSGYVTAAQSAKNDAVSAKNSAQTYATNASNSATAAAGSANTASSKATVATNKATAADNSATSAASSATTATNKANAAATSANTASTKATAAANSATAASNSATFASGYANTAKDWATKTSGKVDGNEYSSKYYAQQAETSASSVSQWAEVLSNFIVDNGKICQIIEEVS